MAARFRAMSSVGGAGATITVTYNSTFYNKTITCSDGTTTYTKTTTSSGSTEFKVKDEGTWTVTCNGVSRQVQVTLNYSTQMTITKTITVYGAASETISFTDASGAKTVTTNASGQGSVNITFIPPSQNITFTSSIAKNPADISQYYSKTVSITNATTEVYVMPSNVLYWYGYASSNLEDCTTANGWSQTNWNIRAGTHNTNSIRLSGANGYYCGIGTKNTINSITKTKCIIDANRIAESSAYGVLDLSTAKSNPWSTYRIAAYVLGSSGINYCEWDYTANNAYINCATYSEGIIDVYALWYE